MLELLRLLFNVLVGLLRDRQDLGVANLLLRHQLAVALRSRPRPKLRARDKLLWVLTRWFCPRWPHHLVLFRPATVIRWHRQGWRRFWRGTSGSRGGRPHLSAGMRDLTATISRENPLWGTERSRGALLQLGSTVSNRSIRRYRRRS